MVGTISLPVEPGRVWFRDTDRAKYRPILEGADAKKTFDSIPIVDVADIFSPDLAVRKGIAREIGRAAEEVGFFYTINPPIAPEKMDAAFEVIKEFFALPEEDKMAYHMEKSPAGKGFTPTEPKNPYTANRETFSMGNDYTEQEQHFISVAPPGTLRLNQWPDDRLPRFRKVLYEYFIDTYKFSKKLIQMFSLSIGLEETALDHFFRLPLSGLTINHYTPHSNTSEVREVLFPHADYGAFTLLLQQVPGLQVLNANAKWVPVPVKEHVYVVNTGNYLELLSNGRFRSTVHRVLAESNTDRISLPFFFSPDPSAVITPQIADPTEEPKFGSIDIGNSYVRGMMDDRPEHPFVVKMKSMGLTAKDYKYEMLTQPIL